MKSNIVIRLNKMMAGLLMLIFCSSSAFANIFPMDYANIVWNTDQKVSAQQTIDSYSFAKYTYNRNGALWPNIYMHTDVPTTVGFKYRLQFAIENNNRQVDLKIDGTTVQLLSNTSGLMIYEFIAKKQITRISLGGRNSYQSTFSLVRTYMEPVGDWQDSGTYVGSVFVEETLDVSSPDLQSRVCANGVCKMKLGLANDGAPHVLRFYLAEVGVQGPISISAGSNVTGVASNLVNTMIGMSAGLYIEISFMAGTREADLSLRKALDGRYLLHFDGKF